MEPALMTKIVDKMTTDLLNSLHVGKLGSAAASISNITKNVAATTSTAAENVTKTASIASPSAEKATEKPAAKQPGFEGILAITGLSAMGYIRLARKQ